MEGIHCTDFFSEVVVVSCHVDETLYLPYAQNGK